MFESNITINIHPSPCEALSRIFSVCGHSAVTLLKFVCVTRGDPIVLSCIVFRFFVAPFLMRVAPTFGSIGFFRSLVFSRSGHSLVVYSNWGPSTRTPCSWRGGPRAFRASWRVPRSDALCPSNFTLMILEVTRGLSSVALQTKYTLHRKSTFFLSGTFKVALSRH